jgi:hypothetical protein
MTQEEPREDDTFYALRAIKRARELEKKSERHQGFLPPERANFAGWLAEDDVVPLNVLSELGRIEDETTFWTTVEWYFEKADHLHLLPTSEEEIAEDIRRMREEGRPLPS